MSGMQSCNYSTDRIFCNGRPYGVNKQENDCRFCEIYSKNELLKKTLNTVTMKITLDETNKTIEVESGTNLKELYDYLNEHNINFGNYTLINTTINVVIGNPVSPWTNPGTTVPQYPYAPFWTNPIIY